MGIAEREKERKVLEDQLHSIMKKLFTGIASTVLNSDSVCSGCCWWCCNSSAKGVALLLEVTCITFRRYIETAKKSIIANVQNSLRTWCRFCNFWPNKMCIIGRTIVENARLVHREHLRRKITGLNSVSSLCPEYLLESRQMHGEKSWNLVLQALYQNFLDVTNMNIVVMSVYNTRIITWWWQLHWIFLQGLWRYSTTL